jgi:hypothetical protein
MPNKEHINAIDVFYKDYNIEDLMRFLCLWRIGFMMKNTSVLK